MSSTPHLDELTYRADSCGLFQCLRDMPGAAMLDSSHPFSNRGRFDILVADPIPNALPPLPTAASSQATAEWFESLTCSLADTFGKVTPVAEELPFCGGLLGALDYDAGAALNHLSAHPDAQSPRARVGLYRWAVIQDHLRKKAVLVSLPGVSQAERRALIAQLNSPATVAGEPFRLQEAFSSNLGPSGYREAFEQIQTYIQSGDCYQVNLAQRFTARYKGDPWEAYTALRRIAGAPFAAYFEDDTAGALLCLSPERFLSVQGRHVETAPIKGTRPRSDDAAEDAAAAQALLASPKDRAENLMIVDLLRNDLGRACAPGSIHVDRLFEVISYPTVHHLVSTISGELADGLGPTDLLQRSFPGGSITGAPKRRAMEIIAELEPAARQAYCGSVFYVSAHGRMDSNIAIRSLVCDQKEIHCWGGGGIVADSDCEQEYQETLDKVGSFLSELEKSSGLQKD